MNDQDKITKDQAHEIIRKDDLSYRVLFDFVNSVTMIEKQDYTNPVLEICHEAMMKVLGETYFADFHANMMEQYPKPK